MRLESMSHTDCGIPTAKVVSIVLQSFASCTPSCLGIHQSTFGEVIEVSCAHGEGVKFVFLVRFGTILILTEGKLCLQHDFSA